MLNNPQVSNPKDFQVVSFHNSTEFGFTPEMGCMYDGRAINGKTGAPGIDAGETVILPYHIGHQLALNLAKIAIVKTAPAIDPAGIPTGVPLWDKSRLDGLKNSYLTDLYIEEKPVAMTQTDLLMQKVEEYRKLTEDLVAKLGNSQPETTKVEDLSVTNTVSPKAFQDKQEVIAELTKRDIKFDARQNKANLEKLLA